MKTLITDVQDHLRKHAEYRRTVQEIRAMPLDVALDLDIDRAHADRVARGAVYGF